MYGITLAHQSFTILLKSSEGSSELEQKSSVQFLMFIGLVCVSLNLGIGMEVTTDTLSKPFLISPTYLKLVPYEEKFCCSLYQVVELSEYLHKEIGLRVRKSSSYLVDA